MLQPSRTRRTCAQIRLPAARNMLPARSGPTALRCRPLAALLLGCVLLLLAACGGDATPTSVPTPAPTPTPAGPTILGATCNAAACDAAVEVLRYGKFELTVDLRANYTNPFDAREVALDALFTGPDGVAWRVPGFWDGDGQWRIRFAPAQEGAWQYAITVRDATGASAPLAGAFTATPSPSRGWLQVGSWVDPAYSPRYLAHHDGTPFYGIGHCDAFTVMRGGFDADRGFGLFSDMVAAGENTVVYWPLYSNSFIASDYDRYQPVDLKLIDLIVADAERKGVYLIFTIWNHDLLRDQTHPWGNSAWETLNGFRTLGTLEEFFASEGEMGAWQENLYRYIIARWSYSPAIGMWLTVSEIEGTNVGARKDEWHTRVNDYFVKHDPFRHPTSASMAGDQWWPEGYAVTDIPQIHSYDTTDDMVAIGPRLAYWTQRMWEAEAKPNFIGEFGARRASLQPDHLHNGVWAALATGAALTPMDWNDGNSWGDMTPEMYDQMRHVATFVADLPFVQLNPVPLPADSGRETLASWALGGEDWGFAWVQDVSQIGKDVAEQRANTVAQENVTITVRGVADGAYTVRPFDTWTGVYLTSITTTAADGTLAIELPAFTRDVAVRWVRE